MSQKALKLTSVDRSYIIIIYDGFFKLFVKSNNLYLGNYLFINIKHLGKLLRSDIERHSL